MSDDARTRLLDAERVYRQADAFCSFSLSQAKESLAEDKPLPASWSLDSRRYRDRKGEAEGDFIRAALSYFGDKWCEPFIIEPFIYRLEEAGKGDVFIAVEHNLACVTQVNRIEKIPGRVVLSGIGYRVVVAEEMVVFTEDQPIFGCQSRFSFRRNCNCWYVSIEGQRDEVMVSHVLRAARIVCDNFGGSFEGRRGEYRL